LFALIGYGVVEAQGEDGEVVNLWGGRDGTCPELENGGFLCEGANSGGTSNAPVGCRGGFKYTVPAGKKYEITDVFNKAAPPFGLWRRDSLNRT